MIKSTNNTYVFNMLFSDEVFTYDFYNEIGHIGKIDQNDTFVAKNNPLNILVFVLSFDYFSSVIVDERKYLKFCIWKN